MMFPVFVSAIDSPADESFVELLYTQHRDKIYKTAYKILKHVQDAEDSTADTFVKIIDTIHNYYGKSEDELSAVFVTIAKNTALDKHRRKGKIIFVPLSEEMTNEDDSDVVGDIVATEEVYERLYAAIDKLDEEYAQIVKLKMGCDYSDKKNGTILNISESNVKIRYHRAKKMLLKILKEK